jgi:hypothetical protein
VDAGFGYTQKKSHRKFMASGHSRWSLENEEPFNFFWRFNRGQIIQFDGSGRFPFALATDPIAMIARAVAVPHPLTEPVTHTRRVIQLAPAAFLIVDESDTDLPQCTRFHLPDSNFEIRDGILHTDYVATEHSDALRLYIVSLNGISPELGESDLPEKEGLEQFKTREISFKVGTQSAYVICSQPIDAPFMVQGTSVSGMEWSISLGFPKQGAPWQLIDNISHETVSW